jgi:hypothetical protein
MNESGRFIGAAIFHFFLFHCEIGRCQVPAPELQSVFRQIFLSNQRDCYTTRLRHVRPQPKNAYESMAALYNFILSHQTIVPERLMWLRNRTLTTFVRTTHGRTPPSARSGDADLCQTMLFRVKVYCRVSNSIVSSQHLEYVGFWCSS